MIGIDLFNNYERAAGDIAGKAKVTFRVYGLVLQAHEHACARIETNIHQAVSVSET